MSVSNDIEGSDAADCPVCYEKAPASLMERCCCSCDARCCQTCWKLWLETCETNKAKATCPGCRQELPDGVVEIVLGRKWETATSPPMASDIMDEFTRTWMQNHLITLCQNCGAWIEMTEGCPAMMCLCGYRFCWVCEVPAEECRCGNCDDIGDFYDNTLQAHLAEISTELVDDIDDEGSPALKVASADEFMELRTFLEWRKENLNQRKESM